MARARADVVLLTGYPSFAARRMCEELVSSDDGTLVRAVVHRKLAREAHEAWIALAPEQRARVELIEGDAAALDLGLSGQELMALASEVTCIHHMAQVSWQGADPGEAEALNLGGAREILEVASACSKLRCLVFHSTALVSGTRTGMVYEDDLDRGQAHRNAVEATLARAERMMRAAMGRVPIAVVRPTIVVGDSRTGEVGRLDGPYFLVLLVVTSPPDLPIPSLGKGDAPLHLVPVDYVVRAAAAIGRNPRAVGRTFHLGDPSPPTARRFFELVAASGGRRTAKAHIPANLTKALLRTPGIDRFVKSPRAFVDALGTPVTYSFANATEILADTSIRCPPFESYVDALVDHVQARLREKRAQRAEVFDPLL